ncbi:type II toxin-antitoxin system HigB family toxin [soil metagenome]
MNIIGKPILIQFWNENRETENSLKAWIQIVENGTFKHIFDLKQSFRYADAIGNCTAFNIKGNHYRLITQINYETRAVLVLYVLTHGEYDKGLEKSGLRLLNLEREK